MNNEQGVRCTKRHRLSIAWRQASTKHNQVRQLEVPIGKPMPPVSCCNCFIKQQTQNGGGPMQHNSVIHQNTIAPKHLV